MASEFVNESENRQRWENVCRKLRWPIRWEVQNPPPDLDMITSLLSRRKWVVLSDPIKIEEMHEMIEKLYGWPRWKKDSVRDFITHFVLKLARCGLKYDDRQYYACAN